MKIGKKVLEENHMAPFEHQVRVPTLREIKDGHFDVFFDAHFLPFTDMKKVGKYWNATEVVMKDLDKNHSTRILVTDVKFDQGLSDDIFMVENLKPAEKKKSN